MRMVNGAPDAAVDCIRRQSLWRELKESEEVQLLNVNCLLRVMRGWKENI